MKYKVVVLGISRTGTTMVWKTLGGHPEISNSFIKEPEFPFVIHSINEYLGFFNLNKSIFLDGTAAIHKEKYIEFLQSVPIFDVVCIFVKRDKLLTITSRIEHYARLWFNGKSQFRPNWLDENNRIHYLKLKKDVEFFIRADKPDLKLIFGKNNYITIEIEKLNEEQGRIYDFLDIEHIKLNFEKERNREVILNVTINKLKAISNIRKYVKRIINE